jgi:hypothetical protein
MVLGLRYQHERISHLLAVQHLHCRPASGSYSGSLPGCGRMQVGAVFTEVLQAYELATHAHSGWVEYARASAKMRPRSAAICPLSI